MRRKTLTIFFADVQGYTIRTGRQTREQNEIFVKEIRTFVEDNIKEKGGTFVKAMGDGFLGTFESPTDAVGCGQQMQKKIDERNSNVLRQDNFIRFRIGISTGEVTLDDSGDVFGDAVNIAARIQKFASPNDVYISEATYLAMNKSEIKAQDLGPQRFKNVLHEIRVYKVFQGLPELSELPLGPDKNKKSPFLKKILIPVAIITVIVVLFLFLKSLSPARLNNKEYNFEHNYQPDIEKLMADGNFGPIIGWAESQLEKTPQDINMHELLAEVFQKMRDWDQAEFHLKSIAEIVPNEPFAYMAMADIFEQTGRNEQAIQMLAEYINREPNQYKRRKALDRMKDIEARIKEQALELNQHTPTEYKPQYNNQPLPAPYPNENNQNNAFRDSRDWRENAPIPDIQRLMQEGNYGEIIEWAQGELERNPDNLEAHELLSRVYLEMRNWGQAEMHLREVMQMMPDNTLLYFRLAVIYEKANQIDNAIHTLRLFINKENDPQKKQKAIRKVKQLERRKYHPQF
ncbi:MAG: tetratricopeptide repeat protein [Candidatus Omnitrophota bacterium]